MTWQDRGISLAGGIFGGLGFAAGLWITRRHLIPLLDKPIEAAKDDAHDPVHAVVMSIENLHRKLGKR